MSACIHEDTALDPRIRRTRKLLQDAFRALIHEKQFAAITVQEITERAGVNRATFYAHYRDKEELGASTIKDDLQTALLQRLGERRESIPEHLVEIAAGVFEFVAGLEGPCQAHAAGLRNGLGTALPDYLYELMLLWLSHKAASRRYFPDIPKETAANVLAWSIYGGAIRWSQQANRPPAVQVCREIVSLLLPEQAGQQEALD